MANKTSAFPLPWWFKPVFFVFFSIAIDVGHSMLGKMPWQLDYAMAMLSALGLSVALLFIPKPILAKYAPSANKITIAGLIIWWVAIVYLWATSDIYYGLKLVGIGGVLDVLDGKKAVADKEAGIARSARSKRIGKWLDPLCDKLKYPPIILFFALEGIIDIRLAVCIIAFDVFGSLIRNPVNIGARMYWSAKKMEPGWKRWALNFVGRRMVRKSKASGFGKWKSTIQSLGLLICAPYHQRWCFSLLFLPDITYSFALTFGLMSIVSRMRIRPAIDRLIDRIGNAILPADHADLKLGWF